MGCDIHTHTERRNANGSFEVTDHDFIDYRSYGTFAFLAGVRNYSAIKPISEPRGIPDDVSAVVKADFESWDCDAHTPSWLSVDELLAFDYSASMEDRRCSRQIGPNSWTGGATCEPGEGKQMTYLEFLGEGFVDEVKALKADGVDRIVFWFDN